MAAFSLSPCGRGNTHTVKPLLGALIFVVLAAAILFGSAGRVDLPFFWAVVTIAGVHMLVSVLVMDPALRRERVAPGAGGVSRAFRLMMIPIIVGSWVIAGLDVGRFHWSDTVPTWARAVGLVVMVLSMALATWAVRVNRFFSPVIRVQSERGHHVVTAGPYRFVRHPGYAATMLVFLFATLALGSWIATALAVPYAAMVVRRTVVEERFLRENLPGYTDYTATTRWRLLPGVW